MDAQTMIALATPVLALVGSWIGVRVGMARHDERLKVVEGKSAELSRRTHRHSSLLTVLASKAGVTEIPNLHGD